MVERAQAHSATLVRRAAQDGIAGGNRLGLRRRMSRFVVVTNKRSPLGADLLFERCEGLQWGKFSLSRPWRFATVRLKNETIWQGPVTS
jgi:hypothetical protein